MKKNTIVIDASCLVHFQDKEPEAIQFKRLIRDNWDARCTELAILETLYILCREYGWEEAQKKVKALRESNTIRIEPINFYGDIAAKIKCERAIALPDCLTIALAEYLKSHAVFAHREKELALALQQRPFNIEIVFLDEIVAKMKNTASNENVF